MQKQVLHNQSVLDCMLQNTGGLTNIIEFALLNDLSVTDDLVAGTFFDFPLIEDTDIYNYFIAKKIIPATSITGEVVKMEATGIGAMIIDTSFIIR